MPHTIPYRVDTMTVADLERVMEIENVAHVSPWPESAYRHELEQNALASYIVLLPANYQDHPNPTIRQRIARWLRRPRRGRPILGYAGYWMMVGEAHISTIAVDPEWRGQGLGELLLLEMLEHAIVANAVLMTLEVRVSNEAAHALYSKYRFEVVGHRKRYYRNNNEDANIMTVEPIQAAEYRTFLDQRWLQMEERMKPADDENIKKSG